MKTLLEMSLTGGVMICVIGLFRGLFQNRVGRRTFLLLWAVVLVRLLVPVTVASPTSVYNLPAFRQEAIASVQQEEPAADRAASPGQAAQTAAPEPERTIRWGRILELVWLAGAVGCMGYFLGSHLTARRHYRFSVPVPELPPPKGVQLRMLDGLTSPLTYGIVHPVVLLPPQLVRQGGPRLEHILRHELAHVRHHDVAKKLLLLLAASIHWFNPLVWVMVYLACQDLEMYCDETVVRALNREDKLSYAQTLVAMEEAKLMGYLQTGFSFSSTGSRLKAIVRAKVHPVFGRVLAAGLCGVLVVCFFTGQVTQAAVAPKREPVPVQTVPETQPAGAEPATLPLEPAAAPTQPAGTEPTPVPTEPEATEPGPAEEAPATPTAPEATLPAATEPEETTAPDQAWMDHASDLISPKYGANITFNTPGAMTMTVGENRTVSVSCEYAVDFFTDDPSIVYANSWSSGNSRLCSLNAAKAGTVNLYYQVWYGGEPHLYATITVLPDGDTDEVDFSDINDDTLDIDPPAPGFFPEPSEPEGDAIEIPGGSE